MCWDTFWAGFEAIATALAFIAAVGAGIYARSAAKSGRAAALSTAAQLGIEIARDRLRDDAEKRRQADQFSAWVDVTYSDEPEVDGRKAITRFILHRQNLSAQPFFGVRTYLDAGPFTLEVWPPIGVFPPGQDQPIRMTEEPATYILLAIRDAANDPVNLVPARIGLSFRDLSDNEWTRMFDGTLKPERVDIRRRGGIPHGAVLRQVQIDYRYRK